jgi:large subunit ribosomal protein L35Ae
VRGKHISFTRGKRNTTPSTSLIKIEGCDSIQDAEFYLGKRIAYVYRAQRAIRGSKVRVIWGKVTRSHGNNGVVRAKFRNNLPPKSLGANVRVVYLLTTVLISDAVPVEYLELLELAWVVYLCARSIEEINLLAS